MDRILTNYIKRYPDFKWNFCSLSEHPHVFLRTLTDFENAPWNFSKLVDHPHFKWEWITKLPNKPWDWRKISAHPRFSWDWVREFPGANWSWKLLSERVKSVDILKEFPDKPWDWYTLTLSPDISPQTMMEYPNLPWVISELYFTLIEDDEVEFIRTFRSHYDMYSWVDHSKHAPWSVVKKNMDLPWVYSQVKIDHFDPEEDIQALLEVSTWDWNYLSGILDFELVISKNLNLRWNFEHVSKNPSVSIRHVKMYPNLPWNLNSIRIENDLVEWRAADTIKRYWKRCVTDPSFKMCQKLVLKVLNESWFSAA